MSMSNIKTVLFFTSASRYSCRKRLAGTQRYFKDSDIQIQVIEQNHHKVNITKLIDFWHPIGCIVECGSNNHERCPEAFGKLPVVYLDKDPQSGKQVKFSVNPDLAGSAHMAARELLSLGFSDYAFVGFDRPLFWSNIRERIFIEDIHLNSCRCHVFNPETRHGADRVTALGRWLLQLPKPCGLFAAFDETAATVLAACAKEEIKVPEEIAVLGVDNEEEICEHTKPTLSSICPDFENAGYLCAELLDMYMHNKRAKGESRTYGLLGLVRRHSTRIFKRKDAKATEIVEYIRQHACEDFRIEDVVKLMGCSRRTAEMRFKALTGQTIQEMVRKARMDHVFALLRNPSQTIDGIAQLCGYESDSTLRYAFKAKTGLSMREWRKIHLGRSIC